MRVSGREEKVRGVKQITCGTFETFLDLLLTPSTHTNPDTHTQMRAYIHTYIHMATAAAESAAS